jgi:hypothetical protein
MKIENSLNLQVNLRENKEMYLGLSDSQEVKTQRTNLLKYLVLQEKQKTPAFFFIQ